MDAMSESTVGRILDKIETAVMAKSATETRHDLKLAAEVAMRYLEKLSTAYSVPICDLVRWTSTNVLEKHGNG